MATFTHVVIVAASVLVATNSAAPNIRKRINIPEECIGKGFCNIKPEGYDDVLMVVNKLLTPYLLEKKQIADRIGDKPSELSPSSDWHNCPSIKTSLAPYFYHGPNQTEADIIVQLPWLNQPIETIKCAHDKIPASAGREQCFQHAGLNSLDMESRCQTTETWRTLLVMDSVTGKIEQKEFPVPCCCSCKIFNMI